MSFESSVIGLPFMPKDELVTRIDECGCIMEIIQHDIDGLPHYKKCVIKHLIESRTEELREQLAKTISKERV